ncbi:hypothetical protein JVT61DRAFT_3901 [Boletus reticuloceps]|uniref:NUA/TPR/MLP1-2-like domain-containing protein n=1 Tax=Boletus reticuloceps TaxID=495285 RepID=A0A8I3A9I4_9AGAM|nr:hypothetical protein JVT61DRAFT_3901 [Boletus reticuloceps]
MEESQKLKESGLLQHQLTDNLGQQVQALLKELGRHNDPSDEELDEMGPLPADNTDAVITQNLVLFCSIPSLQEQNEKLLIVHKLSAKKNKNTVDCFKK